MYTGTGISKEKAKSSPGGGAPEPGSRNDTKGKGAGRNEKGSQTLWLPANARGIRTDVTSPLYRDKDHAHSAATYAEFVVDHAARKERLFYRVYLGGNETTDFNLLEKSLPHSPERIRDREEGTEGQNFFAKFLQHTAEIPHLYFCSSVRSSTWRTFPHLKKIHRQKKERAGRLKNGRSALAEN